MSSKKLNCGNCSATFESIKHLSSHIRHYHGELNTKNRSLKYNCGQSGCSRSFTLFSSLRKHLEKCHLDILENDPNEGGHNLDENSEQSTENALENVPQGTIDPIPHASQVLGEPGPSCHSESFLQQQLQSEEEGREEIPFHHLAAQFVCSLSANTNMTGASVQRVMDGCDMLIDSVTTNLKNHCIQLLKSKNIDISAPEVESVLDKFEVDSPFQKIKNIDTQIKYFKDNFNLVEPQEIMLGTRVESKLKKGGVTFQPVVVNDTCQYVPIVESLKFILQHKDVREAIQNENTSMEEGLLCKFVDGKAFKQHTFFKRHPHAVRLVLYYDDVEITNPLGSKTIIHKLGAFYYTIQNLPQLLQSFLGGIHLLVMCHSEDTKKYGFERILSPFINDMKELESEERVTIDCGNEQYVLRATVATLCGDGLAAHQLYGLLGPGSRHFCRMCMISREQLLSGTFEIQEPRTPTLFDHQVQLAKENQLNQTQTGVREECVLNKLKHFHCSLNYNFDAMHDLLEGICPLEIKLVLHEYIVVQGLFSVEFLNSRIYLFNYGYFERRNKPSPNFTSILIRNTQDHKIKQKAMQTWCLTRVLPFLLSDKVTEDDPYMDLIILLQRIMEIVYSPKIPQSMIPLLETLITDHNTLFTKLFPLKNLINKHHHLAHYPDCTEMFGPLLHLWCMRFEAKHHMFKRHASVCCNFKNITKTMSRVAQLIQCNYWGFGQSVLSDKVECNSGMTVPIDEVKAKDYFLQKGLALSDLVFVTKKAQVNGTDYIVGGHVVLNSGLDADENLPQFGQINEIVILNKKEVFLTVERVISTHYEKNYNAISITQSLNKKEETLRIQDLVDFKCMCLWKDFRWGRNYIHLRNITY